MTTLYLSPIGAIIQAFTNQGIVLAGGKAYTYVGGSVSTPVATYTAADGLTLNANPIVLSSAGRPASGSGLVSVWVPANTPHKLVLTDAAGNVLYQVDNLYGINDPTGAIASITIDTIANGVKSYDIFASMRAAATPAPASGVTVIVIAEGGASVGDGFGGAFYWSASSAAADDNVNVIKPTAVSGNGRYLRLPWNASNGVDDALGLQTLGWRDMPQNIQNANYGFVLADRGKQVYHSSATPHTYTLPANSGVAFPIGAVIDVVNDNGGGAVTIAITTDTLRWQPTGGTGGRTLAANGSATLKKIAATTWAIYGVGVT